MILWRITRRFFIFILVNFFRLRNFLWRSNFHQQRFTLRLLRWANVHNRRIPYSLLLPLAPLLKMMNKSSATGQRSRRILVLISRSLLLSLLFILCVTFNRPWSIQHLAIISNNYFPLSASYPPSTMVLLFNGQRRLWPPWPLLCRSTNGTHTLTSLAKVRHAFTPILICGWAVYLAVCPTVQWPTEFSLRNTQIQSKSVAIPYRRVSTAKHSVVACFSPLFYNERWQLIIPTLEIYRQYGVSLQVYYIQSMLVEILDFMRVYERERVVRLETWTRLNVSAGPDGTTPLDYDPNAELEWRNQAAAHTDCLLYFKEATEFIIVSDLDDVLIPRLGTTFVEEFRFLSVKHPTAAGFLYNRYNTELITTNDPAEFSLIALINEARVASEWEDPKYVVKPANVQSVWLHWPGIIDRGHMQQVPDAQNFMLHFRNWSMIDLSSSFLPRLQRVFKMFRYQISDIIPPESAAKLEQNFRDFLLRTPGLADTFGRLPQRVLYYPMIAACYNRIFYGLNKHPINCPGPSRCELPALPGVRCAVSVRNYGHAAIDSHVMIHYPLEASGMFSVSSLGCRI